MFHHFSSAFVNISKTLKYHILAMFFFCQMFINRRVVLNCCHQHLIFIFEFIRYQFPVRCMIQQT